jgi:DNA-binding beta-propeller fold protein YncE
MRLVCSMLVLAAAVLPGRAAEKIVLVAGGGTEDISKGIGPATKVKLVGPFGVAFDKGGTMYIVEMPGRCVLTVGDKDVVTLLAGTRPKEDGRDASEFNGPHSLAVGPDGAVYVADTWNNRVRKIDPKRGTISAFAGTGEKGFAGDGGPAAKAQFGGVYCIAFDPKGERMYLADLDNRRVRAIDMKTGTASTVAGNGQKGVPEDGSDAVKAPLVDPRAVAADGAGNVYILERGGNALRVVDAKGKIRTVAGTGKAGATGDGGPAREATFNGPKHLCVDGDGNVLIADTENHLIRKYLPKEGKVVRVAGSGQKGTAGLDGPPEKAELNQPHGVTVHNGALYISDSSNNRVLKIERR